MNYGSARLLQLGQARNFVLQNLVDANDVQPRKPIKYRLTVDATRVTLPRVGRNRRKG